MRIKIFKDSIHTELEEKVNTWIANNENQVKVLQIQFLETKYGFAVLIHYRNEY